MSEEHEYAFDIKLAAVIRVKAESKEEAEKIAKRALDCADLSLAELDGDARITEASLNVDDVDFLVLFEIDGEDIEDLEDE